VRFVHMAMNPKCRLVCFDDAGEIRDEGSVHRPGRNMPRMERSWVHGVMSNADRRPTMRLGQLIDQPLALRPVPTAGLAVGIRHPLPS
jgi:hypothetical protein